MLQRINGRITEIERLQKEILSLLQIQETDLAEDDHQIDLHFDAGKLTGRTLKQLKMAAIVDRFTYESFSPECELLELTPDKWRQEIERFSPDLLLVESAWEGKEKLWYRKIVGCSNEFYDLTEFCHAQGIPVVFWCKEDPVHNAAFMNAARRADFVFTTDIDCVERYKTELGHERVYHLHFAAQPALHNPIEKKERLDKFCFAGAYYNRFTERCRVFDKFAEVFIANQGLDIYDRNYPNPRPEHKFPDCYNDRILGRLDPKEIDIAYKGYTYGINMNSVTQSQTMFARRVFELMASNTTIVGNYARGVKNYFGDLTISTDDSNTLQAMLDKYCKTEMQQHKYRLLSLRAVLKEHLYEDRLDTIVQKVFRHSMKPDLPLVYVVSKVENSVQADYIWKMFDQQSYSNRRLLMIGPEDLICQGDCQMLTYNQADEIALGQYNGAYVAYFSPADWYGENYLLDLCLALRFGDFSAVGKAVYYRSAQGEPELYREDHVYRYTEKLFARRAILQTENCKTMSLNALEADTVWTEEGQFSIDEFNYCANWTDERCPAAEDLVVHDCGIPLTKIENTAEHISAEIQSPECLTITPEQIAGIKISPKIPVQISFKDRKAIFSSQLAAGAHEYVYMNSPVEIASFMDDGTIHVCFQGAGSLDLVCCCIFYDAAHKKLGPLFPKLGRNEQLRPPAGAAYMDLGFRPKGPGSAVIHNIGIGRTNKRNMLKGCFLARSNVLVLSNHYPAPDDLYRNMFVHKRMTAYKEQNCIFDLMRMNPYAKNEFREFEGINVVEGHEDTLDTILTYGGIDTVCVHFLDRDMWEILKGHLSSIRLIIWSHGADIQPWWRRKFNYKTEDELEQAKKKSEKLMALWHEVFDAAEQPGNNIYFVFVSEYAKSIVEEDYRRALNRTAIIPNYIDTELFSYQSKVSKDRLHVVMIRPFSSLIYGNDMAVNAVCALSREPWFSAMTFTIVGHGTDFEKITAPLKKFKNVTLENKFLRQQEIADHYHQNGIVLIPTRGDTQGVSRDEAMSCGVVPITNAVAAIPEFTDETCAVLAPAEDFLALADGIKRLYENEELFLQMSKNAAARVRRQSSREYTIDRELHLICSVWFQMQTQERGVLLTNNGQEACTYEILQDGEKYEEYTLNCKQVFFPLLDSGNYQIVCRHTSPWDEIRSPVFSFAAGTKSAKISIFGSCVSRDIFRIFPSHAFELKSYIARQSVVSAVSKPVPCELSSIKLSSEFQKKSVLSDFTKTAFEQFSKDQSDWLIIDLIDERLPLIQLAETIITQSTSAVNSGLLPNRSEIVRREFDGNDFFVKGICIKEYISAFCKKALRIYKPDHIIIHHALAVRQYWDLEGRRAAYSKEQQEAGQGLNKLLEYMYSAFKAELPQAREINCTNDYIGSEAHTWGHANVHYEDGYYADALRQLCNIVF